MVQVLNKKSTLFEIIKLMIFLPKYIELSDDQIVVERHPTKLLDLLNVELKEIESILEKKDNIRYRNVLTIPKTEYYAPDILTTKAPDLKTEINGFWKKLRPDQIGLDKKGNPIHGKTWVERKLTWLETNEEENVTLYKTHGQDILTVDNEGIIYVMRSAAHSKDIFKVGLTKRSPDIRSTELARTTGSPDKFLVVEEWFVNDCSNAEKEIHQKIDRFRINPKREFFQAPYDILRKEIIEVVNKYKSN